MKIRLEFNDGTVLIQGELPDSAFEQIPELKFDRRVGLYRTPAYRYDQVIWYLRREKIDYDDQARDYDSVSLKLLIEREARDYQAEAVAAWSKAKSRGVIVLPTGSGKSYVAILAMLRRPRSTLIVSPTIDLMNQWYDLLDSYFGLPVGVIGGGSYQLEKLTVTTYDSAYLHLGNIGNKFGLVIFDECHHLPGPSYSVGAQLSLAPFRLGLTATPERPDGRESMLRPLIGETVYRRDIQDLKGEVLSEYTVETIYVDLSEAELAEYTAARKIYRDFVESAGIMLGGKYGWHNFIIASAKSAKGREAFEAWRQQRKIALASPRKLAVLKQILKDHYKDRVIIFTNDNASVYQISRQFLIPAITHQTKTKERQQTLKAFNSGELPFLVTSKVLNEGVNVPAANVGVILSGSATVREHVQRLGRILRKVEGKKATLYEVIARDTAEESISDRRRRHGAYRDERKRPAPPKTPTQSPQSPQSAN